MADSSILAQITEKIMAYGRENLRDPKHLILDPKTWTQLLDDQREYLRYMVDQPGYLTKVRGLTVSILPDSPYRDQPKYMEVA